MITQRIQQNRGTVKKWRNRWAQAVPEIDEKEIEKPWASAWTLTVVLEDAPSTRETLSLYSRTRGANYHAILSHSGGVRFPPHALGTLSHTITNTWRNPSNGPSTENY
ncbi:MAG: hypothetical protein M1493_14260 [Firmicutes bacterium]|uniref:Uncharacterized protein n=1 Tax=Sulfobacillus benefaciens TaxID=453960 RepID=A0A2T2X8Z5_9FIRM|nr:hypothetical protein [Bacillota bacterium]PSR30962.1 MAG: hypothetical protein C7B43_03665 [Sulfobacillus benefaciens]